MVSISRESRMRVSRYSKRNARVTPANRVDESSDLGAKLLARLGDALGQPLHPRILGLEGLAELPVSRLELGRLLLEVADQWILQDRGQRLRVRARRLREQALLGDPLRLRLQRRIVHGRQLLVVEVLALAHPLP